MAKVQGLLFGLATVVLVVVSVFYFTKEWMPPLKGDRIAIDHGIAISLAITGVVFVLTNLLLAWVSFRYQDRPGAVASYWHDHAGLEWSWTGVTALILFFFLFGALRLWGQIVNTPPPADALVVEITGQQFAWNVRYPGADGTLGRTDARHASQENPIGLDKSDPAAADDLMLLNQLYIPQGRAVSLHIRSVDVLHSFFLPNFRVKQDAVPGLTIQTWFVPRDAGDFEIACAEHCGLGHYRMRGQLHVVPAAEFDQALAAATQ
jgi:cytochrome c oxidase subunit 2